VFEKHFVSLLETYLVIVGETRHLSIPQEANVIIHSQLVELFGCMFCRRFLVAIRLSERAKSHSHPSISATEFAVFRGFEVSLLRRASTSLVGGPVSCVS